MRWPPAWGINELFAKHKPDIFAFHAYPWLIHLKQQLKDKLIEHKQYMDKNGEDLPEIRTWKGNVTAMKQINL